LVVNITVIADKEVVQKHREKASENEAQNRVQTAHFAYMNATHTDTNDMEDMVKTEAAHHAARRVPMFGQGEVEVNFSSESPMACCGEELKPFWADDGRFIGVCRRCGQKYTDTAQVRYGGSPWIGVDLDGTLAHDLGNNRGNRSLEQIGSPIKPMLNRLRKWIAEGKTVKIFTARASSPKQVVMVKKWLASYGLPDLEVTNVKDLRMVELWDDRCVQVMTNLGEPIENGTALNRGGQVPMRGFGGRPESTGLLSRLRIFLTL
jgi:hypothetical protein